MNGFPVSLGDKLQISSWNSLASCALTVRGYTRAPDGSPVPFSAFHTPNTDRTINSTLIDLPDGELVNVSVFASTGTPQRGQTFVRLQILRGASASGTIQASIAAGYVTSGQPIVFPGSGCQSSIEGRGFLRRVAGTNPAAGAEISETVPTGAVWFLRSILWQLVTDGTVSNRNSGITLDDGSTIFARSQVGNTQAASLTVTYTYADNYPTTPSSSQGNFGPLPRSNRLRPGWRINSSTSNLQAGDDYGAPSLYVEEWLTAES